jgi:hypothetical protein
VHELARGYRSGKCRFVRNVSTQNSDNASRPHTDQNTNLLSRINFLEQANANQSRQLLNIQKKMETTDEGATQMVADFYTRMDGWIIHLIFENTKRLAEHKVIKPKTVE